MIRTIRKLQRRIEAGRREMRQDTRLAYQSDTWTMSQFKRELRYSTRLHRLGQGVSPWRQHHGI